MSISIPARRTGNVDLAPVVVCFDVYTVLYGAQRSMLELYAHWQKERRFRVHFLHVAEGELPEAVRKLEIPTHHLPVGPLLGSYHKRLLQLRACDYPPLAWEMWRFGGLVHRLLREVRADLLHCNTDRATLMAFLGARRAGCPVVTHFRRDRSFGRLDRLVYRQSAAMIWISQGIRDEFVRRHHLGPPHGPVIYNGRSLADAAAPRTDHEVREEFHLPTDARIALALAGFDERKDHETLIEAARIACAAESRLFFLLAGNDVTPDRHRRRKIEAMVRDFGLERRVLFLGFRCDAGRLIRGSNLVVNSAREEGLGGALMEAMGYGVPCVYVDTGGTREVVPPDRCGYAVPRGDARALAGGILELLGDDPTHRRFSECARKHFQDHFRIERCAELTAKLFEEVIQRKRRRQVMARGTSASSVGG